MRKFPVWNTIIFQIYWWLFIYPLEIINRFFPQNLKILLFLRQTYHYSHKWNKAEQILGKAITFNPKNLHFQRIFGMHWLTLEQYDKAAKYFEYCINSWDDDIKDQHGQANNYALLSICYIAMEKFDEAENLLTKAKSIAPWDLNVCLGMTRLYSSTGRKDEIPNILNEYIQAYPFPYLPFAWMAHHIHYYFNQPKESLDWYDKTVAKMNDPENVTYCDQYNMPNDSTLVNILREYIHALIKVEKQKHALNIIYNFRIKKYIDRTEAVILLSRYYALNGDFKQAEVISLELLKTFQINPVIWEFIAEAHFDNNHNEEARYYINQALKLDPELSSAIEMLKEIDLADQKRNNDLNTY